jgi:hypothetical protein
MALRSLLARLFRYGAALFCIGIAILWRGAEPPVLELNQAQADEGIYHCYLSPGRSVSGSGKVNGHAYATSFSYIFGVHTPTACFTELHNQPVRVTYLRDANTGMRLQLEVLDLQKSRILGTTKERKFALYQSEIGSKFTLYLARSALLLVGIHLIFGEWMRRRIKALKVETILAGKQA